MRKWKIKLIKQDQRIELSPIITEKKSQFNKLKVISEAHATVLKERGTQKTVTSCNILSILGSIHAISN